MISETNETNNSIFKLIGNQALEGLSFVVVIVIALEIISQ